MKRPPSEKPMNWPPVLFIGIILPGFSFSAQPPLKDAEATRRRVETLYRQFDELMKSTPPKPATQHPHGDLRL